MYSFDDYKLEYARGHVCNNICVLFYIARSGLLHGGSGGIEKLVSDYCCRHFYSGPVNERKKKKRTDCSIDCGATVCILPKRYLKNLEVRPEIVNLQMWNKSSVKALGKCKVHVKNPVTNEKFKVDFVIVNEAFTPTHYSYSFS